MHRTQMLLKCSRRLCNSKMREIRRRWNSAHSARGLKFLVPANITMRNWEGVKAVLGSIMLRKNFLRKKHKIERNSEKISKAKKISCRQEVSWPTKAKWSWLKRAVPWINQTHSLLSFKGIIIILGIKASKAPTRREVVVGNEIYQLPIAM